MAQWGEGSGQGDIWLIVKNVISVTKYLKTTKWVVGMSKNSAIPLKS